MQNSYPLVSIITINYIHIKETIDFLESVKKLTYPNIEVIVVDNCSPVGKPTRKIHEKFSFAKFIESNQNLGFAGGNNVGIKESSGKYIFLLNNDTILYESFLEPIITFMENHPDAGMASPKVLFEDGVTIQYAGAVAINPFTGRGKRLGLLEKDYGQYDDIRKTDLGHGAALIIPRKIIEEVGLMPEIYFLYYEEHDWCEQIKNFGYSMYYIGTSKIIHKESVSTGGDYSPLKVYYMTRSRILYMRRNSTSWSLFAGLIVFTISTIPKKTLQFLVKGKFNLLSAFFNGIWWNIVNWQLK